MWGWFPEGVSTFADRVDGIFYIILAITGVIFVLVEATLILFIVKYRHREGRKAEHIHGNWKVEAIWTAIPFVIVIFLAAISLGPWLDIRNPDRFPAGYAIDVTAKQFEWNVVYAGVDGQIGTADDVSKRNLLYVPAGRPVVINLRSDDVIHSLFLPEMRVKQDAVPGMETPVWFEATTPGEYVLGCAELCGLGHYRMRGTVTVLAEDEFERWQRAEAGGPGALSMNER